MTIILWYNFDQLLELMENTRAITYMYLLCDSGLFAREFDRYSCQNLVGNGGILLKINDLHVKYIYK